MHSLSSYRKMIYLASALLILLLSSRYKSTLASIPYQTVPVATSTDTPGTVPTLPATATNQAPTATQPPKTATATLQPATFTPTNTPVPATATATNTATEADTATATFTDTPSTATATNTATASHTPTSATATSTDLPATPTPTNTPTADTETPESTPEPTTTEKPESNDRLPTATPTSCSLPDSFRAAIANFLNHAGCNVDGNPKPLTEFQKNDYQLTAGPLSAQFAGIPSTFELMQNTITGTIVVVISRGESSNAYLLDAQTPLYKAIIYLKMMPLTPEITIQLNGKNYHVQLVIDSATGELFYFVAEVTDAPDGTVIYGVVLKLDTP